MGLMSLVGTTAALAQTNAAPDDEINDIRPPYFYLGSLNSMWWLPLLLLALAIVAVVLFLVLRPGRQLSAKSAYDLALEKLERARGLIREDNPIPYAVMVSETIRSYLGQRFQSPSTRRTTEEILRQMESDRTTPLAEHRELLRDFLQSCDLVKFARYQPRLAELEHVQQRARDFVLATKPEPKPGEHNGNHAR
jgi:hypothetical protein